MAKTKEKNDSIGMLLLELQRFSLTVEELKPNVKIYKKSIEKLTNKIHKCMKDYYQQFELRQ